MEAAVGLLALLILGAVIAFPVYVLVRLSDHTSQLNALRRELAALARTPREEAPTPAPAAPPAERPQQAVPQAPPQPVVPRPWPVPPPTPVPAQARPVTAPAARTAAPAAPAAPAPLPPAGPPSGALPTPGAPRSFDFEAVVGANWLAKLGVIAIAVAAAFFLKYAIDVGWVGKTARVALGLAAAAVMLGIGQWLLAKPRYRTYAQALASGGIVILFLSIYAAYNYYHLIGFGPAFAVLAVAALAASLLALSNDTQAVAVLCILGGFATPLLIRSGTPGPGDLTHLYAYLVGLNLWTIALVRLRPWHSLLVLSLGASWLIFFGAGQLDRGHYWVVEGFAALFLLFSFLGGRRFAGERTGDGPVSPEAGVTIILLGFLAFAAASSYALAGVALFGLPALAAVGIALAVALVAAPYALGNLREAGPTVAALLRGLGSVALLGLVAITIAASPAVTGRQAPPAFVFTVLSYLLFLAIALHMQRQPGGEQPAIGLVLANALTHAVSAAHALAPLRLFGLPTVLFWLPVAGWIGLAALPLARRRDEAVPGLSASLMSVAGVLPLVSLFGLWGSLPLRPQVLPALAAFGAEFLLLSTSWVALRRATRGSNLRGDVWGQLATAAIFFALFAALAWGRTWEGLSLLCGCALALALYYAVVGSLLLVREDDDLLRRLTYLGLALTFVTIAIPLQLSAAALTVAWAAESVVLVWTGLVVQERRLRWYGLLLLAVTTAKTLGLDLPHVSAHGFLLNPGFLSGLAVSLAAYFSAYALWRRREVLSTGERALPVSAVLVGSALAVIFLGAELWSATGVRWPVAGRESAQQFALTLLWSVAAMVAMGAGTRYRSTPVQVLGGVLLSLALTKVLFVDITFPVSPFRVLVNTRSGAAAAVIAALYFTAAARRSHGEGEATGLRGLRAAMLAAASLLTLIFGSLDLWERAAGQFSAQQLSLSIFWSCYALVVFSVGIALRLRAVRLSAMGLLYVAVFKVFLLDLNSLDTPYRIISFLGLGLILLLVSLLYHRFEERLR